MARLITYVSDEVIYKQRHLPLAEHHLQSIWLEIGFGRAKKHLVNFYYREHTSCVTGSRDSQLTHLKQLIRGWRDALGEGRDLVAMGDANLDVNLWQDPQYWNYYLAREVHEFLLSESCVQLVDKYT